MHTHQSKQFALQLRLKPSNHQLHRIPNLSDSLVLGRLDAVNISLHVLDETDELDVAPAYQAQLLHDLPHVLVVFRLDGLERVTCVLQGRHTVYNTQKYNNSVWKCFH